jgi:DNA-binding XRE family transcriptional regulator
MAPSAQATEKPGKIIANIIRTRRAEMKIGQGELAEMIGAHAQTMNKIERGEIDFSRFFSKIEEALQIEEGALVRAGSGRQVFVLHGNLSHRTAARATQEQLDAKFTRVNNTLSEATDLPLYASNSIAGEDFMTLSPEPISLTVRPTPLANVRGAYAVLVSTPTMIPAYEPGDTIWVHPHLPAEHHKDVLLRRDAEGKPGSESILGRLTGETSTHWLVREHNTRHKASPRRVAKKVYPHCHRTIGKLCR